MKPVGLPDPRTGREAVRDRAAAAGQPRRRSLQPGRLPDPDEVGRAGARAAADPRPRERRVRPLRHDPSATPTSTARRCCARPGRRRARRPVLRRADFRRRRLCRVRGLGADRRPQCRGARAGQPRVPPRTTAIGALAYYVSHANPRHYQPTNITFGIMPADRRPAPADAENARSKLAHRTRACALDDWIARPVAVDEAQIPCRRPRR